MLPFNPLDFVPKKPLDDSGSALFVAFLLIFALVTAKAAMAVLVGTGGPLQAQDTKPNVVFILADNVGYGDLAPYGGGELRGAPIPRIDQRYLEADQ